MNSDLPPFNSFALESGRSIPVAGDVQTLTLGADLAPTTQSPMAGRATIDLAVDAGTQVLRAAVVPSEGSGLTLTF